MINRYVLVDRENNAGEYEYESYREAVEAADGDHAVVERQYTFEDEDLAWTPDGSTVWPPTEQEATTETLDNSD